MNLHVQITNRGKRNAHIVWNNGRPTPPYIFTPPINFIRPGETFTHRLTEPMLTIVGKVSVLLLDMEQEKDK